MLSVAEIRRFIDEDKASERKMFARKGQAYYDGDHDIKDYRLFYYNEDGNLVEDTLRSNVKISHPFFTELVDQAVQYILSGTDGFVFSDNPKLQEQLDEYFNNNDDFIAELTETLTGCIVKGDDFMHAHKNADDKTTFKCADSMGVVEVRAKDTDDETEHVIYWYIDRIDKGFKKIKRIQVWDASDIYYYVQIDDGEIEVDKTEKPNPRPHTLYQEEDGVITWDDYGVIPFFRLDNGKKRRSSLHAIKDLIDDYDLMASSLSNNLIDFDSPIHVVKGYEGDDLGKLQQNLKTKKIVATDADGGIEVHTVDIPYDARKAKLELDEKNIYRFGMGLNTSGLKDTNATTNIAIKAAYSLLDLRCAKLTIYLKKFLRKLISVVLAEINAAGGTDYQQKDVYVEFEHEIMSNAKENAEIAKIEADTKQIIVNTILNVAAQIGDEKALEKICEALEIDFDEIKDQLDKTNANQSVADAKAALEGVVTDDEPPTENSPTAIP